MPANPTQKKLSSFRFRRQWIVSPEEPKFLDNWISQPMGETGFSLHHHPETRVRICSNGKVGFAILGIATLQDTTQLHFTPTEISNSKYFEKKVIATSGSYVIIRFINELIELYTDPAAMACIYYKFQHASSSPNLLPDPRINKIVARQFRFQKTDDWYPGTLTPFVETKSLLANHSLNLKTSSQSRFWPKANFESINKIYSIEKAANILRNNVLAYSKIGIPLISLTGGKDSRVNLAASLPIKDKIQYFTLNGPKVNKCDIEAPRKLSIEHRLNHMEIEIPPPQQEILELYDEISGGMAIGARREVGSACWQFRKKPFIHINGNLGAITKSFFWHSNNPKAIKRRALLNEFIQKPQIIVDSTIEWLNTVPTGLSATTVYNLMYLEQRGGKWMAPGENASLLYYESATPFNSRAFFEEVSGLPTNTQRDGLLLESFVEFLWPELLAVPYCKNTRKLSRLLPKGIVSAIKSKILR